MVGGEEVGYSGEFVKEVVFEAECWGWPDNGGLGIDFADNFFSPSLFPLAPFVLFLQRDQPWWQRTRKESPC